MDRLQLLSSAGLLNEKLVSLPRLEVMGVLADIAPEPAEYRELKAGLKMGDGKLIANLNTLIDMGYLAAQSVKVENKTLTAYSLTPEGMKAWATTRSWLSAWLAAS